MPEEKPYQLIPFSPQRPNLNSPTGHDKFQSGYLHGTLFLSLTVRTPLHISTGILVMGSDINLNHELILTMTQGTDENPIISGSSLKGCVRAVYEAITNSTLGVINRDFQGNIPQERLPYGQRNSLCEKNKLCPASRIFGALNWQGLVDFTDARCQQTSVIQFIPCLYPPQPKINNNLNSEYFDANGKVKGRKFYYHTMRAVNQGVPACCAGTESIFTTRLHFKNLKPEELGTLLIILGQDSNYLIALKLGAGKPVGMGTMTVEVTEAKVLQDEQELRNRYSNYNLSDENILTGEDLKEFMNRQIQTAHNNSNLIDNNQLGSLVEILRYPTNREPPEGMY